MPHSSNPNTINVATVSVSSVDDSTPLKDFLAKTVGNQHCPTMVVVGGASRLSHEDLQRVEAVFTNVLAPLAEEFGLIVVDGGTDAGVMRLMGNARTAIAGTFPLIGVAPIDLVNLPGNPSVYEDAADLEANHTHCFLVPGNQWGDESPWIASLATTLAADYPSVVVLINGGSVTWQDARFNVEANRPIVVLAGSGRAANILGEAIAGRPVDDERAYALIQSGLLQSVDLYQAEAVLMDTLKTILQLP